jgi:hypothetical protein
MFSISSLSFCSYLTLDCTLCSGFSCFRHSLFRRNTKLNELDFIIRSNPKPKSPDRHLNTLRNKKKSKGASAKEIPSRKYAFLLETERMQNDGIRSFTPALNPAVLQRSSSTPMPSLPKSDGNHSSPMLGKSASLDDQSEKMELSYLRCVLFSPIAGASTLTRGVSDSLLSFRPTQLTRTNRTSYQPRAYRRNQEQAHKIVVTIAQSSKPLIDMTPIQVVRESMTPREDIGMDQSLMDCCSSGYNTPLSSNGEDHYNNWIGDDISLEPGAFSIMSPSFCKDHQVLENIINVSLPAFFSDEDNDGDDVFLK